MDTAVSYNKELEAAIVRECLETDRSEDLKQSLELTTPAGFSDANTPLRKVRCINKTYCRQMELYTDYKKEEPLLIHSETKNQLNGASGQGSGFEMFGGKLINFGNDLHVTCNDNELVTKFNFDEDRTPHFMIQNDRWKDQFLTVSQCKVGTAITYSKKGDGHDLQKTFYEKNGSIHSAYCGDKWALDLPWNNCANRKQIFIHPSNGSAAQKFSFIGGGKIAVNSCYLDGGGRANAPYLWVWKSENNNPWMYWNKIEVGTTKIRDIWCGKPKPLAGLYVNNTDTKETGQIKNVSDEASCEKGYSISGYKCRDALCDAISLICKKIKVRIFCFTRILDPFIYYRVFTILSYIRLSPNTK